MSTHSDAEFVELERTVADLRQTLALRNSEFGERIEQQTATIEVLKTMSSAPDDTQPVFDQIVGRARDLATVTPPGCSNFGTAWYISTQRTVTSISVRRRWRPSWRNTRCPPREGPSSAGRFSNVGIN